MRPIVVAAVVSVFGSVALGCVADPRAQPVLVSTGLVAWGIVVLVLLPRAESENRPVAAGPALLVLMGVAALIRAPFLWWPPTLSDDVHRYVWEGRVWLAGYSPLVLAPDASELTSLRDANWALVNHQAVSSVYPPLAQALFVVLSPFGVVGMKLFMGATDVVTAMVLWHRERRAGWLWALLPLPALEAAGNGHLEAVGALLVALALRGSDAAAWLGAMLKLLPAVFLVRRRPRVWLVAALASALAGWPLTGDGVLSGFRNYGNHWSFNGSMYGLITMVLDDGHARPLLLALGLLVSVWALATRRDRASLGLWVFGAFVVLSPTVHPWYVLWPLVPALWRGERAWLWLAAVAPLSYLVLATADEAGAWHEAGWVRIVEYGPFFLLLLHDSWRRFCRAGP
ncbi:MAG: hypothetical protein EXR71_06055 [Myxococcales bacterium]|nr:hypothetical protein [Myxococcales bacterium]